MKSKCVAITEIPPKSCYSLKGLQDICHLSTLEFSKRLPRYTVRPSVDVRHACRVAAICQLSVEFKMQKKNTDKLVLKIVINNHCKYTFNIQMIIMLSSLESNLPFRIFGIFVISIDAPVDSAV